MAVLAVAAAIGAAHGQTPAPTGGALADAPGPVGGVPDKLPDLQMPGVDQLRLAVPRPVRAATAALGLGRQRLALVMGLGTLGSRQVLDSAPRDSLAVATALRTAGFVVMVREDATSADLRAALKEFHQRLQPGGMGLLYVTALGAQVDGRNLLLPRDAPLDAAAPAAAVADSLRSSAVPVQELVDALMGTSDSPRMLVLDAAYKHPALDKLPQSGLLAQALPPGMMALFAQSPLAVQEVPAVAPLPTPAPTDPQLLAASPFARMLVRSVLTPKLSGAEVLRSTHRAMVDSTQGAVTPWIAGDTDAKEELAEMTLLDAVLPRTPEEYAREGMKRAVAQMTKGGGAHAGEQPVSEVLQQTQAQAPAPATPAAPATPQAPALPTDNARTSVPDLPANPSALGSAASALGTAASVAGTVASVAGTAATVAVGVKVAQAVVAANVATTAVGAATAVAGNAVALATRLGSGGSGETATRQAVSAVAAAPAPSAAAAVATVPSAALATAAPPAVRTASAAPAVARSLAASAGERAVDELLQSSPAVAAAAQPAEARRPAPAAEANAPPAIDGRTTRNPDGGERPVYTPRSNSFGYAEGDTFSYRITDTWKGEVTGRYTTAIEEVLDNGQMLANGQQVALDAQGRLQSLRNLDGSRQRFEPHQDLWWSKPTPGQSRNVDFKEIIERGDRTRRETQFKGSSSVGKLQKIETPAGEFEAMPIETSGWYHERLANGTLNSGKFERTVWYAPKLGHPVAIDIKDVDRLGKLLKRERVELTHAQQVRTAP